MARQRTKGGQRAYLARGNDRRAENRSFQAFVRSFLKRGRSRRKSTSS